MKSSRGLQVAGGGTMRYRSSDPAYLAHVDRWWRPLLAKVQPLLYQNGGSVIMVQARSHHAQHMHPPERDEAGTKSASAVHAKPALAVCLSLLSQLGGVSGLLGPSI